MKKPPEAHQVHRTENRLRVRVPSKKGDEDYFEQLSQEFADHDGVEEVFVNPHTGSALFVHKTDPRKIVHHAAENQLFTIVPKKQPVQTLFGGVADVLREGNKKLKRMTGGELDVRSLVFLLLLVSGAYQLFRGNVAVPAWYTAFYYAMQIFPGGEVDEPDEGMDLVDDIGDLDM
jgi:hypothetical protein